MTGDDLLKMMQGARAAAVMKAALELEVFESLAGEGRSPGEVAVAVGADPRGMRILLDALAALGVVERDGKHYSVATEHPHAQVTSQDWPNVLAETRRIALERGLAGRASFVPGDAFEVRLGGPHDLIILSLFLHHFDESRCRLMLDRVARALAPGGKIAIHALAPSGEAPHTDPAPFVFSAVMLAWTRAGEAYPVEFYRRLCQAVGLGTFETHRSAETPSTMMIASRE